MIKNPKVFGAFVVGFALVAGSYVISNVGSHTPLQQPALSVAHSDTIDRKYINVTDADNNGIEDWREEFATIEPIILPVQSSSTPYLPPSTVTELMGIQFFESYLLAKGQTGYGPTEEQVIENTVDRIQKSVKDVLYSTNDITVIPNSPEAIRTYANTIAQIMTNNNVANYEDELVILNRALQTENPAEVEKLQPLVNMYRNMRDQTRAVPVPQSLVKQHLDLINVYQALYRSLDDMGLIFEDPMVALMRIQRYQDDATGLDNALRNMYTALLPNASLFTENDPAVLFVLFAPNYQ